ncbi:paraquat-inducible protein B [Pseudomonas lurida]|jgi:paraquat-inducible protein B|uniref:Chemotaxis protein n=2 Tax=Pseudomonas TaxID=286 RepID=A0A5E6PZ59_PSEFL|nr:MULTISPECIES: hypothetical protein [Pseudomonas]VVM12374.1 hypothetical protein PS683_00650 [Pseudomonas fluorescens]AVJ39501.1 hypothetical protein CLM75_19985 [Pseudomonas lurida]MBC3234886.1 hypothetical protein [Pseudomonas lurida]MBC3240458.1 hypothetical protein [Pseudomonas lurida]MBC3244548.1 hypothetical protein [Pseudomonas lurida]
MLSISGINPSSIRIPAATQPQKDTVADKTNSASTPPSDAMQAEGVPVTISGAAMKAAADQKTSNSDIDDSGLSDNIKNLLKMIRQIKKQIAEKQAEMAALLADKNLSPDQVRARLSGLQSALSALQASLTGVQASLTKAMKDMTVNDAAKTAALAMK